MNNIVVIYWSGTGNTEAMAQAIAEGAEAKLVNVSDASIDDVKGAAAVALGSPSMGSEVIEESEMEPFVESIEGIVSGKKLALFGSYGWGDGQWMSDWYERMESKGVNLVDEGLTINETPDDEGLEQCRELGKKLAASI